MLAILQFDSPSVLVLDRLVRDGRLPTLARLRARAAPRPLETPAALFEGGVYPTLHCGVDVGEHGIYSALPWIASEQRVRFLLDAPKPETVWERVGRAGRRSLVVDPYQGWPTTAPGIFLGGWQLRSRMVLPRASSPPSAFGALARRFGRPPRAETIHGRHSASALRAIRAALLDAPRRAADAVVHLLGRERFDFLWVTFGGAHVAGHHLWPAPGTPDASLANAVEDVYVAVDAAIGRVVAALPPDADVLVLSPDGMGPNTSRSDLLPGMLAAILGGNRSGRKRGADGAVWRFRAAVPLDVRDRVARVVGDAAARELGMRLHHRGVDWRRTRAFAVPGDCAGFVRLNLRGRERDGVVEPSEAAALADEIASGLSTFRDPDGAPAVAAVERPSASGRRRDALPDLVVRWSDRPSAALAGVASPRFGDVRRHGAGTGLPGNHAEGAWIVVLPGRTRPRELGRRTRLVDVAATACALMGADDRGLAGDPFLAPA
jgi:predicted AlkP superfamily phosphohydrolase/phosphomutase